MIKIDSDNDAQYLRPKTHHNLKFSCSCERLNKNEVFAFALGEWERARDDRKGSAEVQWAEGKKLAIGRLCVMKAQSLWLTQSTDLVVPCLPPMMIIELQRGRGHECRLDFWGVAEGGGRGDE